MGKHTDNNLTDGHFRHSSSDRMLPNSHYISIAQRVAKACSARGVAYRFELYSEVARTPKVVTEFPGSGKQLTNPKTFDQSLNALEDFDVLEPHLTRCVNEPLLTSTRETILAAGATTPHPAVYGTLFHGALFLAC